MSILRVGGLYIPSEPFGQTFWYGQNSHWVHSIFPNAKYFSQFIDKLLEFEEMEYLNHLC